MECFICKKRLSGRYYVDQWDHKMCEAHMNNDAVYCYSCTCFTKKDITLPDGRILCPVCMANAVRPVDSVAFLTSTVIKTLNKVGFDVLSQEDIKLEIISADKMAQVRKSSVNLQNKGLTLSNVSQSFSLLGGKKQAFNHVIYMLTHLTKNEFAGVLAHEMLHAWQIQNGISMSPQRTEGFCNMGSYLVYITMAGSLNKLYLKQLHENPDPVYGDGFREMYRYFEELDWKRLIQCVRERKL